VRQNLLKIFVVGNVEEESTGINRRRRHFPASLPAEPS
jgi:hypothetical protein